MTSGLEVGIVGWAEGRNWGSWGHCAPLEVGSKRKERPHQASCYRSGGESGGIGSQNQWRTVGPPSPYLLPWKEHPWVIRGEMLRLVS